MKKLMFMAVACVMSFAASAAATNWSASNVYQPGTTTAGASYLFYCFDDATYSRASALADLNNGDTSFVSKALGSGAVTSGGKIAKNGLGDYANSTDVTGYIVIFDAAALDDAANAYVTATATGTTGATGQSASLKFNSQAATGTASNWVALSSTPAIPEPTSGLLMLVGLGALALRRRRAYVSV